MLNRVGIVWLIMHILTCVCIRQQDPSSLTGRRLSGYIDNTYFMMSTASTVGYGDFTIDHKRTYDTELTLLFGVFIMILALGFFSFMQSTFFSLRARFQAAESEHRKEINSIEEWMVLRNMRGKRALSFAYEHKVKALLRYVSRHDHSVVINSDWHKQLPDAVQYLVEIEIMRNLVVKFHFLKNLGDEKLGISIVRNASIER